MPVRLALGAREPQVQYPGEFTRANRALEATIKVKPTVVLTNSLPYRMHVSALAAARFNSRVRSPMHDCD